MEKRIAIALCLVLLTCGISHAAPKAELWERWLANDSWSALTVDHAPWDGFLDKYLVPGVDGINRIAYGKVTEKDRGDLENYLEYLEAQPVSRLNRDKQRAFWINLYNSLTVKFILDYYPVESIRDIDISPGFFAVGPWDKKLAAVEGVAVSLNDIEHRILRPIWKDPRIHYAVNCASVGCPNLQPQAYTALNSEALLEKGAGEYINHPRGVWFDRGRVKVSSIYKWFMSDFGGDHKGVMGHLGKYASPVLKKRLEGKRRFRGHAYDWSLNDAR
jgi:hypothetical protein